MSIATAPLTRDAARGGKYLTFFLGHEEYGVAIPRVQEIVGLRAIARVPRTPVFVRGVIDLRGKTIPLVDLRERFGMLPADASASGDAQQVARAEALRCVVVVEVALGGGAGRGAAGRIPIGVVVDRVSEVSMVDAEAIDDLPTFGVTVPTDFLLGLATGGGRVRLLLDIDRVLAQDAVDQPARAAA